VRQSISDQCEAFSDNPCGIYRLNVPTGGGKTLSSLRYALAHAEKYGKKRIIFIIPLLSVLDQNAKVIREYLKDSSIVTEHHSNVIREHENGENVGELDIYETVTDNWTSPVIISTLVQLLNIFIQIRHRMQGG
jgi:CRISPR-associated endonuclease/helicase Cas3